MGSSRPIKYNPAFLTQDELIQSFVVRNTDLELIMELIHENRGQTNQHLLVVGSRGTGKTTLALRVAAEIRRNKDFLKLWYPIVFSEESYEVCSPGEFWLEALFHIGKHTKDQRWKRIYKELRSEMDESRLRDRALAQVMDFADVQGKRLLVIVENLNMILGQQIDQDAAWEIRHTLINEPRLMLLGTAINRFEQIENTDKAMFELFKIHELLPLSSDECRTLWKSITGQELKGDRIRPVQILTGGSPRLLVIISDFAAKASFRELMMDLTHLVDEHTEYFKSHIDNLPSLERKIFVTLADLWQPSTAREVAVAARMDVNKSSAYLKRLITKGAVMEVEQEGGRKWYQLAERMYNIYHLMRRRGEPSNRVRAVVDFMVHFYSEEELVNTISSIAEEACGIDSESRLDHYQALIEILKNPQVDKHRQEIIAKIPKKLFDSPDLPESLRLLTGLDIAPSVESVSFTEEELQSVMPNNPNDPNAWIGLGAMLVKEANRLDDAEKAYREAVRLDPNNLRALGGLALLLGGKGSFSEAEKLCKKVFDINPDITTIWELYGLLLSSDINRYEEAEKAYRKAIEIDPNRVSTWEALGYLYTIHFNRPEEAEKAYRKAIEIDPDKASTWEVLGYLYTRYLNRPEEAEKAYRKAVEIDPDNAYNWGNLGSLLYVGLKKYNESEKALRKAIDLDPNLVIALGGLAFLLDDLERYEEAESYYKRVLKISQKDSLILFQLSELYRKTSRFEESEQTYYKVLEVDPNSIEYWINLISLQMDDLYLPEKALNTAQTAIEKNNRSPEMLNALALTFYQNGWNDYLGISEKWCREAIEKKKDNYAYILTLAFILGAMMRWEEALEISLRFLRNTEFVFENLTDVTSFMINAAAAGYANDGVEMLEQSDVRKVMEPLITGFKIFLGVKVRAPQEIMEIGKDVANRIKERMIDLSKKNQ